MRKGSEHTVMFSAGKFCQTSCVLFSGHDVMYGARSVQAMLCVIAGTNHIYDGCKCRIPRTLDTILTGIGKRPSN